MIRDTPGNGKKKENASQSDPALKSFAQYVLSSEKFPLSSNPTILAAYLYKKLNYLQAKGFQLFMILYKQTEENNQLPAGLKKNDEAFLEAINTIVLLQNSDSA